MKNEERILELLAETLQRMDRRDAEIERIWKKLDLDQKALERHQDEIDALIVQLQKHQERLERHGEAFGSLRERTEAIHQSALEQQKAYQAITNSVMYHNRALAAKGIL